MTAAFRSLSASAYGVAHLNTVLAPPAGLADGDLLVLIHLIGGNYGLVNVATMPDGFTLLPGFPSRSPVSSFEIDTRIAYKVASSESGNYTVMHDPATTEGLLFAVSGSTGIPVCTLNSGTGTISTATGLTTRAANSLVAFIAHNWELYGGADPPSGTTPTFTEQFDSDTQLSYLATGVQITASPTGDKTHANLNSTGDPWSAFLMEILSPESAPTPIPGHLKIYSGMF